MKCPVCGVEVTGNQPWEKCLTHHLHKHHPTLSRLVADSDQVDRCLCGKSFGRHNNWEDTDASMLGHVLSCEVFVDAVLIYRVSGGLHVLPTVRL